MFMALLTVLSISFQAIRSLEKVSSCLYDAEFSVSTSVSSRSHFVSKATTSCSSSEIRSRTLCHSKSSVSTFMLCFPFGLFVSETWEPHCNYHTKSYRESQPEF